MTRRRLTLEPVAIVGIGCLHPQAARTEAFRNLLANGCPEFSPFPSGRFWQVPETVHACLRSLRGAFFKQLDFERQNFRIPKVFERAVSSTTLMLMQAVRGCIADAGYDPDGTQLPREKTNVVAGVCFGFDSTLTNSLKVHGLEWLENRDRASIEAGRKALRSHFGLSSHDRVGEMSSSIAARIGALYGCHGRIMAVENADATGYAAIRTAMLSLSERQSDAVLVATGQRWVSALTPLVLEAKGFSNGTSSGSPDDAGGVPLGEGATALLLKRLEDARRDGDRIRAVITGLAARRVDSLELRYNSSAQTMREVAAGACSMAGVDPNEIASVECALPSFTNGAADVSAAFPGRPLTSAATVLGHTFANAGTAGIAAAALARDSAEDTASAAPIAVIGASITGLTWMLVLHGSAWTAPVDRLPAEPASPQPVAVVGIGGCFGTSPRTSAFRDALLGNVDDLRRISDRALPRSTAFDATSAQALTSYAECGSELTAEWERYFDPKRLRLFPRRVAALDSTHKLALAVVAEALDGFDFESRRGTLGRGMVVVASPLCLANERNLSNRLHAPELAAVLGPDATRLATAQETADAIDHLTLDGMLAGNIAALISGCFRLEAEGMIVEAACASSIAAVQIGMQALRRGDADWVVAGGVELPVNMRDLVLCSTQRMLSEDKIAPFALDADGFSPGDGAGFFVLRRLGDAQRDGDTIYACLIGSGASSDAASMTAPDANGQVRAMRRAIVDACVSPDSIAYVEAHGTGTRIGDGIEIAALKEVYASKGRSTPLLIGSVKSNIGHAFAAAGAASLMKTVLALNSDMVPPTLLRREVNPELALAEIPAAIVSEPRSWPTCCGPRRAAINSMGTGGINFHLVVEAAPLPQHEPQGSDQ